MKTQLRRAFILLLFVLLVLALLKFQGKIFRAEHDVHPVPELQSLPPGAQVVSAQFKVLPESRTYPGFVEPIDPAQISSRVMATVLEVRHREGDAVEAGDVLIQLDDKAARTRLAQAQANLLTAQAGALQAQLAYDRAERLKQAEAFTPQEWESARAHRDATQAMAAQATDAVEEAQTALDWYTLKAPFDGLVLERNIHPGDLASPGQPMMQLYRPGSMRFAVAVPEDLAPRLELGKSMHLQLQGRKQDAQLIRTLPSSDPRTGMVTLHFALASSEPVLPGLLGRLEVTIRDRETLVIPAEAVRRVGQIERVQWVREGKLVPITITTGKSHDGWIEVLTGLAEGEEVYIP